MVEKAKESNFHHPLFTCFNGHFKYALLIAFCRLSSHKKTLPQFCSPHLFGKSKAKSNFAKKSVRINMHLVVGGAVVLQLCTCKIVCEGFCHNPRPSGANPPHSVEKKTEGNF